MVALLTAPLDAYDDVIKLLELRSYPAVAEVLAVGTRRAMAAEVVRSLIRSGRAISSRAKAERLFSFVALLVEERADVPVADDEDLEEEQGLVARMLLSLWSDDAEECMAVLEVAKEPRAPRALGAHAAHARLRGAPAAARGALARRRWGRPRGRRREEEKEEEEEGAAEAHPKGAAVPAPDDLCCTSRRRRVRRSPCAFPAVRRGRRRGGRWSIAYEFYTQAFELYEEELADQRHGRRRWRWVGRACRAQPRRRESRGARVQGHAVQLQAAQEAREGARGRLARTSSGRTERAVRPGPGRRRGGRDAGGGAEGGDAGGDGGGGGAVPRPRERPDVPQARAEAANAAEEMASSVGGGANEAIALYVEILNKYLYFFDRSVPGVTAAMISDLVELIGSDMSKPRARAGEGLLGDARIASKRRRATRRSTRSSCCPPESARQARRARRARGCECAPECALMYSLKTHSRTPSRGSAPCAARPRCARSVRPAVVAVVVAAARRGSCAARRAVLPSLGGA